MFSTEPIVEEKGLINLSCLHVYQLVECARFEMDLLVILYFDCALGQGRGGGCSLISAIWYVQHQRDMFF